MRRRRRAPRLGVLVARVVGANAALSRWERGHPFLSGIVLAPAIFGAVWLFALALHAVFGL